MTGSAARESRLRPLDFVVTGTPRSGTRYAAAVLSRLGFECRHEESFNPWRTAMEVDVPSGHLAGDSSWLAAPFLTMLPPRTRVLHLVRDPLDTVNSIIGTGQIDWPDDYRTFIAKYCWGDEHYWPADVGHDAQLFWVRWNRTIEESGRVTRRVKVEEWPSTIPEIARALGSAGVDQESMDAAIAVPTTVNARHHEGAVTLTRRDLTAECVEMARRYGYDY